MSVMSFVTSFVGAFVTSTVVSRPKPDPKDVAIKELKDEVAASRRYINDLLHRIADERNERSALRGQIAGAEAEAAMWRIRAEMAETMYNGVSLQPPLREHQTGEQLMAQLAVPVDLTPEMIERARVMLNDPGHVHWGACTCVPGRANMFRAPTGVQIRGTHADRIIMDDPTQ